MQNCQQCGRRAQIPLCPTCVGTLDAMLSDLCWLLGELETTLTRQDRLTQGVARLVEHPSPANVGAMELARSVGQSLKSVTDYLDPDLPDASPRLLAWWLRKQLFALVRHQKADKVYRTISALVGVASPGPIHDVINRPDRRCAGSCPDCGALCFARTEDVYVVCDACGVPIDVERNRSATLRQHDLMPERLLLATLDNLDEHVSRVRFYEWVTSGKLPARGYLTAAGIVASKGASKDPKVYSLERTRVLRRQTSELALAPV